MLPYCAVPAPDAEPAGRRGVWPALALAILVGLLALISAPMPARAQTGGSQALKESDNPINDQGGNYNYRSDITSISPDQSGLQLEVLEFADRLLLTNHTGKTVTVYGYQDEPYARVLADGTVEVNTAPPPTTSTRTSTAR